MLSSIGSETAVSQCRSGNPWLLALNRTSQTRSNLDRMSSMRSIQVLKFSSVKSSLKFLPLFLCAWPFRRAFHCYILLPRYTLWWPTGSTKSAWCDTIKRPKFSTRICRLSLRKRLSTPSYCTSCSHAPFMAPAIFSITPKVTNWILRTLRSILISHSDPIWSSWVFSSFCA